MNGHNMLMNDGPQIAKTVYPELLTSSRATFVL